MSRSLLPRRLWSAVRRPGLAALLAAVLSACASSPEKANVALQEDFASADTYSRAYRSSGAETCEAARRALLSQGYVIGSARADQVDGSKAFQPEPEVHVQVSIHVVCTPEATGGGSLAFASAVQDRYTLKKSNTAASLGVGVLGSVSLPVSASNDSMVKVGSETVTAGLFYDRFFTLIAKFLPGGDHDLPAGGPEPAQ